MGKLRSGKAGLTKNVGGSDWSPEAIARMNASRKRQAKRWAARSGKVETRTATREERVQAGERKAERKRLNQSKREYSTNARKVASGQTYRAGGPGRSTAGIVSERTVVRRKGAPEKSACPRCFLTSCDCAV